MTHTEAVSNLASERYLLDEMTEPERDAFETHFFECDECAEDVKAGTIMKDGVKAGFLGSRPVARVATFTPPRKREPVAPLIPAAARQAWYRSAMLPWAVAATLAVMVTYQTQQPSPVAAPEMQASAALTAVLLRPASRGAVPTVSVAASHVALALDVDADGATEVSYELRRAGADSITSGRAPAPVAGVPLLLVIPTFTLMPEQQYILTVRDGANPDRTLGDYRFVATP